MKYKGKLYGKLGKIYFDTSHTAEEWDEMEKRIAELEENSETRGLDLAIELLKRRAISTVKVNVQSMKELSAVLPCSEVVAILEAVKEKSFLAFYHEMRVMGHPDYT